jgi:hypothetical protein
MNKTPNFGENVPPSHPPIEAFRPFLLPPTPLHPTWKRKTLKIRPLATCSRGGGGRTVSFLSIEKKIQFSKSHRLDFGY